MVAARRPPAMVTARLRVQAEGGTAEVSVDGVVRGHTPLSLELPPGKHRVGLRDLASDSVAEQEFDLREGVERLMDVRLDQ